MIITQAHPVMETIKGRSKMCGFVTQHNATDASSWGSMQLACWLAGMFTRVVAREFNVNFSTISHPRCFREFVSMSNQHHNQASCCWGVCWCQSREQRAPWWQWGYCMGGISYEQETHLHFINGNLNAQRYHDEILRPIVVPFICRNHLMFQHDNAQPHVSRNCTQFLEAENGSVLPWPALSPDMSPIEHVWDALDQRVLQLLQFSPISSNFAKPMKRSGTTFHRPQSTAWSMQRRCVTLHEAYGGHTRYWLVFWSMPPTFFKSYL